MRQMAEIVAGVVKDISALEDPELVKPVIPNDCKICGEERVDDDKHDGMCMICCKEEAYREAEQRLHSWW